MENKDELQVGLKEFVEKLIAANDARYTDNFESQKLAVSAALAAAKEAVTKAETAAEKRFESVNEFRNTLSDQQRNLLPRIEADTKFDYFTKSLDSLDKSVADLRLLMTKFLPIDSYETRHSELQRQVNDLREAQKEKEGKGSGLNAGWLYLVGGIALLSGVVALLLNAIRLFGNPAV